MDQEATTSLVPTIRKNYNAGPVTVSELIEMLKKCPPDYPVVAEGCDCEGEAYGITDTTLWVSSTEHPPAVLISRG